MTGPLPALASAPSLATSHRHEAPLWLDIAYGSVGLAATLPWAIVDSWLLFFYLPPSTGGARVPVALYGIPIAAACLVNIVLCPIIGHFSDRARCRWGRRRPFVGLGALLLLAAFALLWQPPVAGMSTLNLVYLALILLAYNIAYSLVEVPFVSLLPELARSESHRVRLATILAVAQLLGVLLAALAGPLIEQLGYTRMAWLYVAMALPFFYLPLPALREEVNRRTSAEDRPSLGASLTFIAHHRSFLMLTGATLCTGLALAFTILIMPFLVTEICARSQADSAWFFGAAVVTSLVCYPAVIWLSRRLGKRRVFAASLGLSALAFPGLALIGPQWPLPLLTQGILWVILESAVAAPVSVLPPAFIADLTDDDARRTGHRREGVFFSVWVLQNQLVAGVAAVVAPVILLLGRSHLNPQGPLGVRVISLVCGGLCAGAYVLIRRYGAPPLAELRGGPAKPEVL